MIENVNSYLKKKENVKTRKKDILLAREDVQFIKIQQALHTRTESHHVAPLAKSRQPTINPTFSSSYFFKNIAVNNSLT